LEPNSGEGEIRRLGNSKNRRTEEMTPNLLQHDWLLAALQLTGNKKKKRGRKWKGGGGGGGVGGGWGGLGGGGGGGGGGEQKKNR